MGETGTPQDLRRSSRLVLSIPVQVSGRDASGVEVHEKATTKYVNKHGALLFLQHQFSMGSEVVVSIPHLERQQRSKVVWLGQGPARGGNYATGIELERAENFWGVEFPPGDWVIPKNIAPAGDQPESLSFPSKIGNDSQEMLRSMLNALVSVLEEKGVVSREELAEKLKRHS